MGIITKPTTFVDGTVPTASQFNGDFDTIYQEFNGSISNANISASAAISASKISGTAKTLAGSVATYAPSAAGTATLTLTTAEEHRITMPAGNITIALTGAADGVKFIVSILQDSVGSRTVTWFNTIRWQNGTVPTLTTTANKRDVFGFICTGSNTFDGFVVGVNV